MEPLHTVKWNVKTKREPWVWIFAATALVMLCAIGIFVWSVVQSRREGGTVTANQLPGRANETLARVFPPAYRRVGSQATPAAFNTAIARYSQRDYAGAIPGLATLVETKPDFVGAHFYLGICYLSTGNAASGIAELRKTIDAGNSPYLEQARFYLAKGLLGSGDIAGARQQLDEVIAIHGDLALQAEALQAQIK
jgi:tetratricopeptide (TPR) repeat protein